MRERNHKDLSMTEDKLTVYEGKLVGDGVDGRWVLSKKLVMMSTVCSM